MTQQLSTPIYQGGAENGLFAPYSIVFPASDLSALIPLNGMWQGDSAPAKSLRINNYESANAISYVGSGNVSGIVPAYSIGSVDVRGMLWIQLTVIIPQTLPIEIWTTEKDYTFTARGNPPNTTGDTFFSSVLHLMHMDGQSGANSVINYGSNGSVLKAAAGNDSIITTDGVFGSGCYQFTAALVGMETTGLTAAQVAYTVDTGVCVEFRLKVLAQAAGGGGESQFLTTTTIGTGAYDPSHGIYAIQRNGANVNQYSIRYVDATTNVKTDNRILNTNQWYACAFNFIGGTCSSYVDGIGFYTGGAICNQGNLGGISFAKNRTAGLSLLVDELRVTTKSRYNTDYQLATAQFPNSL